MSRRLKLSNQQVRYIRGSQRKQMLLGRDFGLPQTSIHQIQNRISYKYVEECDVCNGTGLVAQPDLHIRRVPCPVCQRLSSEKSHAKEYV